MENTQRHCYVTYTGEPYIQKFGIPCYARQNYNYVPQYNDRYRTIIMNRARPNAKHIENFTLMKKQPTQECDCDDNE